MQVSTEYYTRILKLRFTYLKNERYLNTRKNSTNVFCSHITFGRIIRNKFFKLSTMSYYKYEENGKRLSIEKRKECVVKSRKECTARPLINSRFINTI